MHEKCCAFVIRVHDSGQVFKFNAYIVFVPPFHSRPKVYKKVEEKVELIPGLSFFPLGK